MTAPASQPPPIDWASGPRHSSRAWGLSWLVHLAILVLLAFADSPRSERTRGGDREEPEPTADTDGIERSIGLWPNAILPGEPSAGAAGESGSSRSPLGTGPSEPQRSDAVGSIAPEGPIDLERVMDELMSIRGWSPATNQADSHGDSVSASLTERGRDDEATGEHGPTGGWSAPSGGFTSDGWWGASEGASRPDRGLGSLNRGPVESVYLFGLEGTGRRFVYLIDRSASMNDREGRPLAAVKSALIESLQSLTEAQSFELILYNEWPQIYLPGPTDSAGGSRLLRGDAETIERVIRYVRGARAFGDTDHLAALRSALRLGPDVLFFLTDGRQPPLSGQDLEEVRRWAGRSGTVIHAIEFGADASPPVETFVRTLAGQNGGEYRYFPTDSLSHPPPIAAEAVSGEADESSSRDPIPSVGIGKP